MNMEEKEQNSTDENVNQAKNISDEAYWKEKCKEGKRNQTNNASGSVIYFLGAIGAAIYFISNAIGFWAGVLGFMKAFIWPAIIVYEVLNKMGV